MNGLNILHITPFYPPGFAFGGPTYLSAGLANGLHSLGHRIVTITSNRNGDLLSDVPDRIIENEGKEVIYCKTFRGRLLFAPDLITAIKQNIQYADIILNTGMSWNYFFLVCCALSQSYNKPYVVYPQGIFNEWALSYKWLRKKIWWWLFDKKNYQKASAIIALTKDEAIQVRRNGMLNRIEVIPNGVHLPNFDETIPKYEIERKYPRLSGKRWILFMGRLHPIKGIDILLKAMAIVRDSHTDYQLILAGPDENGYVNTINGIIDNLKLSDAVCLTGMVVGDIKKGLFKYSDIFVLTSHSEGLPTVVLEAMASAKPVIITEDCHIPEVKEYNAGFIVCKNPQDIAAKTIEIMDNDNLLRDMGLSALKLVSDKFTWNYVARITSDLISDIVNNKR